MNEKLKVLLSAYACEPGRGSEQGVGWNWALHMAREHEVWVVTRSNNRQPIETALAREPLPNAHFVYYDLPRWARFWKRGAFGLRLYYYLWQAGAYLAARKIAREVRFDLVHHVTFVKYWMPSFFALLDAPFVWGPVGGGESAPKPFRSGFSLRGKLYDVARTFARALGSADPFVKLTARRATLGLATTEDTAIRMRRLGCRDVRVLSEAGLNNENLAELAAAPMRREQPFRILSLGNLLHLKAYHLSLEAFGRFIDGGGEGAYWIVGDGPERGRLEALVHRLGISGKVVFWGRLPRAEALKKLAECDVVAHPSLHDSGGWTCLEAMAAGKPVVCLDLGGPGLQVTSETGMKIRPESQPQAITDLALAFRTLALNPELRARLGAAGRVRVRTEFRWEDKPARLLRACGSEISQGVMR
jgi:glycosyltransferase involved in cell wall biosynthesis